MLFAMLWLGVTPWSPWRQSGVYFAMVSSQRMNARSIRPVCGAPVRAGAEQVGSVELQKPSGSLYGYSWPGAVPASSPERERVAAAAASFLGSSGCLALFEYIQPMAPLS